MKPEAGTKPRVYYLNIPKKFIAGTVYDPKEKEVVIGATCTLTPAAGGAALTVATDEFGDFWFNDIEAGTYALSIMADGFDAKVYEAVDADEGRQPRRHRSVGETQCGEDPAGRSRSRPAGSLRNRPRPDAALGPDDKAQSPMTGVRP